MRCGIFATGNSSRAEAGASYYGVMEMSGNLWERPVTVGNATGRGFTGTHGDGALSPNGNATNADWPGYSGSEVTGATGSGFRGGNWGVSAPLVCMSDRSNAGIDFPHRDGGRTFRGVRSTQSVPSVGSTLDPIKFHGGYYDGYAMGTSLDCERIDCDRNGIINILDVLFVVNCILEITPCLCPCECNLDGSLNILDAYCIVEIVIKGCP